MIDHLSLGTHHYAQAVAFYQQVLAPLGLSLQRDTGAEAAFGAGDQWSFFLYPAATDEPVLAKGMHVALAAPSRQAVQQVHALAMPRRCLTSSRRAYVPTSTPLTLVQCSMTWTGIALRC